MSSILRKKFKLAGTVTSYNYNLAKKVVECLKDGTATVKSSGWLNFRSGMPLDLEVFENWITYDKCIKFNFTLASTDILAEVVVYDGSSLNGMPESKRWEAVLSLPLSFTENISREIDKNLNWLALEAYEEILLKAKEEWLDNWKLKALGE